MWDSRSPIHVIPSVWPCLVCLLNKISVSPSHTCSLYRSIDGWSHILVEFNLIGLISLVSAFIEFFTKCPKIAVFELPDNISRQKKHFNLIVFESQKFISVENVCRICFSLFTLCLRVVRVDVCTKGSLFWWVSWVFSSRSQESYVIAFFSSFSPKHPETAVFHLQNFSGVLIKNHPHIPVLRKLTGVTTEFSSSWLTCRHHVIW